ncbi:pirin family protein [Acinetobacter ihumii]|uniref:pirin family protein n=1 Tax=Acinetobacter ihumii TaxID=2483802 RepID=UPI00103276E3|nr:pirin family protein [Acinetobacter ihumii]
MFDIRYAHERGGSHHGWLQSRHSFSFADYWNPKQVGFSSLLVINEDIVAPSKGFHMHTHRNMEIISYVLAGALEHKDSMGTGSVIQPNDTQLMSAGQGISHSEFNLSSEQDVHLLQIWVVPNVADTQPKYQQMHLNEEDKRGKFHLMIAPQGHERTLAIKQDIYIYVAAFDGSEHADFVVSHNRYVYVHIAKGHIQINKTAFQSGDGIKIRQNQTLSFTDGQQCEVILFDMQPQELPKML